MIIMDAIEFIAEWSERYEAEVARTAARTSKTVTPSFGDQVNAMIMSLPWPVQVMLALLIVWTFYCLLEWRTGYNEKPFYWPWNYGNRKMHTRDRFSRENDFDYDEMFKNKFSRK